ncbi:MAG: outer membrane protein assembly factor BamA [Pseudomonadales bacterium]|nr:outer membrane protein assembly factor BamA [Pseudomonadales bacterium]
MRNIFNKLFLVVALTVFLPLSAFGFGFYVADIHIDGLQRVDERSVFAALPINIGDRIDDDVLARSIKALFKTGNFSDIHVKRDGDVLVIEVEERPAISSIEIDGNKSIGTDQLLDALKMSGLEEGEIFKRATLERIHLELERQYLSQGRYGAKVKTNVTPGARNRVAIDIEVTEGDVARIQHITIVGNQEFTDQELLGQFELKIPGVWGLFSKSDEYAREKLSGDLETLRSYYLDRGFVNFQVESTQVSVSPDKQSVYIAINVFEGDKYKISDVKLAGDLPLPEEKLRNFLLIRKGFYFSDRLVTLSNELLSKQLGNEGYIFSKVNGIPDVNEEDKTVTLTFFIDPGQRSYVRRINFIGNTKTADVVLRREMRQMEGAWASGEKIEFSKTRLNRLGFFKEVNVETPRVGGSNDEIDVNYIVEEGTFGELTASVGYADGTGAVFSGSLSQNNFLGSGNRLSVSLSRSDYQDNYNVTYNDPYYTIDGVSRGVNLFFRETDYEENNGPSTVTNTFGGSVSYGYPIDETQRVSFSFGYTNTEILQSSNLVYIAEILDFLQDQSDFDVFTSSASWNRSTLNRGLFPDRGASQSLQLQISVPNISELEYYKLTYNGQRYFSVKNGWALRLRTELGYGGAYGSSDSLPFFQNYRSGGFGSVRGYRSNTLGPQSSEVALVDATTDFDAEQLCIENVVRNGNVECLVDTDPFGGNLLVEGSVELIFPAPFVKDRRSLRTAFFIDAGNVFDTNRLQYDLASDAFTGRSNNFDVGALRYSVGVGLTWMTAIAPLSFVIARPFGNEDGDRTKSFQFELGRVF